MKLINFTGLTCYSNGIISIVNDLGADYSAAFSALWSETDFYYQPDRKAYLSKRLPEGLERLGLKLIMQLCDTPEQARARLAELFEGEPVIIGMDAFNVPWSQFYQNFHGPHFFAAYYTQGETFLCYDPTFERAGVELSRQSIISHAYDISRILPAPPAAPAPADPLFDAAEVLRILPGLREALAAGISACASGGRENAVRLARYADSLTNNRYMYRHYLERLPGPCSKKYLLMDQKFFLSWSALKNGLFKAAVNGSESVLAEATELLGDIIREEEKLAKRMLLE